MIKITDTQPNMFVLEYDLFDRDQFKHVGLIMDWCKQTLGTFTFDVTADLESRDIQGYGDSFLVKQYIKFKNEHDVLAFKLKWS